MSKYTKYKLYQKYETRGSQEAIPCYPNVFSIDGDGTMPLVIVEENSRDCGYTGETQPIYRWYTLPIDTYYYCDACQDAQYKWVNLPIAEDWECVGTTKYYKQKKMVSVDGGSTWTDVTPPQYQRGALYEYSSQSCGYRTRTSSGSPYCTGYDKYVDVYSQYSTDGGNTWQTTATTNVLLERYSSDCGYVPLTRWVESGWTCIGYDKYVNNVQQISYDDGQTWQNTSNTSASTLIEANSSDCGYEIKYRTTSGTPYCSGYDKYVDVYSQVSYDMGSTWTTTATTPTMIEHNSYDCGYEIKYRTTTGSPYCSGTDKYVDVYSQVSYDMGSTWETTATTPTMIEHNSYDCGYIGYRWTRTNSTLCIGVPQGYTQVEYIKQNSNYNAYINTGVIPFDYTNNSYTISVRLTSTFHSNLPCASIISCEVAEYPYYGLGYRYKCSETVDQLEFFGGYPNYTSSVIDNSDGTKTVMFQSTSNTSWTTNTPLSLLCTFYDISCTIPNRYADATIYSAIIVKNGVTVRDFVPAKRDSDNAVGLYDLITDTFYTSPNGNSFIAGPNV